VLEDDLQDFPVPRIALRRLAETAVPPVIAPPIRPKYPATIWTETTFLAECPPEQRPLQEDLLAWAASQGEVVFGKGAKNASWTLQIHLSDGRRCTLLGVYANGKVWSIWKKLPDELAEPFMEGLRLSSRFDAAIRSGKAWCEVAMQDDAVLPALRAAVTGVTSRLVRMTAAPGGQSR
jgi:hypothetical protein